MRDLCILYDGFGPGSHIVLGFGTTATVVFAMSPDVVVVGATTRVARGLGQSLIVSITLAWEARMEASVASHLLHAHHSSVGCRQRTYLGAESTIWQRGGSPQLYRQASYL